MGNSKLSDKIYYVYRLMAIMLFVLLFLPAANPARISGMVGRSISLLTAGFSYGTLIDNFGRAFRKEWILESTMRLDSISSLFVCIGIFACALGACLSIGNNKCRRLGNIISTAGSSISLIALQGIYVAYTQVAHTKKPEKIDPTFPPFYYGILAILVVMLAVSVYELIVALKAPGEKKFYMETKYRLFLMMMPFILLTFVFSYLPLFGWRYAFFDYKSGDTLSFENFVGFKWFTQLVRNAATRSDMIRVMKNTLGMSFLGILTSWMPMVFAIFLSEIKNSRFRRFVQTFTTIPNFISWVLVFAIAFSIFSTDGFISSLMINLNIWDQGKNFLMSSDYIWIKMLMWGLWKGLGWSAIIYIAGISGIDQQLYEAATVDGAGRFQRMWHVTVPGLMPTFYVLLLMSIAGILSNGMDQYLVFENSTNTTDIMVLDLYVYKMGIVNGAIPFSTAVGMLKSVVSVILLFTANNVSKLVRGETIV
ncbi:putative aldouronate transport system permease protein [Butyrivibrio fibrisolvens DSM 3071]|uniref:Putative aldouronate transport system permease protein n=1 Tax=Butyrivibrio fibrisolvens DSM 3071 TaxID=1121131 RepID=A0A1M6EZ23_BUTFI|nr:ABC transporter permease subunit [Butyrivibrio fibrisolvens]SHI90670.1 putative aldouronate transport system permease protein [Butyrivibrio fibrisolvens DSM 3071]